ncbi:hypothetical protein D3C84_1180770 [compost metagenome]
MGELLSWHCDLYHPFLVLLVGTLNQGDHLLPVLLVADGQLQIAGSPVALIAGIDNHSLR